LIGSVSTRTETSPHEGESIMYHALLFFALLAISIGCLIWWRIRMRESFGVYLGWVLFFLAVAALLFEPWRIF